jgi:hypothetical protein
VERCPSRMADSMLTFLFANSGSTAYRIASSSCFSRRRIASSTSRNYPFLWSPWPISRLRTSSVCSTAFGTCVRFDFDVTVPMKERKG